MEATVKEAKFLKEGTSKKGDWKLYKIVTTEGVEYTTFDTNAGNLTPGAVIELGDITTKADGKSTLKDFAVVTQGEAQGAPQSQGGTGRSNGGGIPESPEVRVSIEAQQAAEYITQVQVAALNSDKPLPSDYFRLVDLKDEWCKQALERSLGMKVRVTAAPAPTSEPSVDELPSGDKRFSNIGQVFAEALKSGVTRAEILAHRGVSEKDAPLLNPDETWEAVYNDLILKK